MHEALAFKNVVFIFRPQKRFTDIQPNGYKELFGSKKLFLPPKWTLRIIILLQNLVIINEEHYVSKTRILSSYLSKI